MKNKRTLRSLGIDSLARVEGEGRFSLTLKGSRVTEARFAIFEPPRFFEALLRGRKYFDAPDFTSRICGICPIAYQLTAVQAMEGIFGAQVDGRLRALRRLVYCGEWIESHALHIHFLQGPDFLGYSDGFEMARDFPEVVKRGLELKKLGNKIISLIGGRAIHPINLRVGGFYGLPRHAELMALRERLKRAVDASFETVRWVCGLPIPEFESDYDFLSLRHPEEYPITEGRLVSSGGLDVAVEEYDGNFVEQQVDYSTSLQTRNRKGGIHFLGPLARLNLNSDRLSGVAADALGEAKRIRGFVPGSRNPFHGIIARAIEVLYAFEEAVRILWEFEPPALPAVGFKVKAGFGSAWTEAPRGTLYHRYEVDEEGMILSARIVPPTSQNQLRMEGDLREWVERRLAENPAVRDEELVLGCEKLLRNYDPCISCATHSLRLKVERG